MMYYKTSRGCVIKSTDFVIEKESDGFHCKNSIGIEIPIEKLYHPMKEYFLDRRILTWVKCKIKMRFYRFRISLRLSRFPRYQDMGYGMLIVCSKGNYLFQYRKEDYDRFIKFING